MKTKLFLMMAALGLVSCSHDLSDHFGAVDNPSTPEEETVTSYTFTVKDLADGALTVTAGKVTDGAGTELATTTGSEYSITSTKLGDATDPLWIEATTADGKYIAKVTKAEVPTIAEAGELKMATLGNIIGIDGKFYEKKSTLPTGVDGAAMIVYLGDDADATTTKKYHGLAISLKDAKTTSPLAYSFTWGKAGVDVAELTNYATWLGDGSATTDMAGIDNTEVLNGLAITDGYVADKRAADYTVTGFDPATYGFSGWFLPSAGQWFKFLTGMCNLTWTDNTTYIKATGDGNDIYAAVNKGFVNAGYDTGDDNGKLSSDWDSGYWTSSEAGTTAIYVRFSGGATYGAQFSSYVKTVPCHVRSFLAF